MVNTRTWAASLAALLALGCGSGDNSAVRAFHPTVTVGSALSDVVVRGEQAQKTDVAFTVRGIECPGGSIEIGRSYGNPYIRVAHVSSKPDDAAEPGYTEEGLPAREAFAKVVAKRLPSFYTCRKFVFQFSRDQVWPTSDSFSVMVDAAGRITSVSDLREDDFGE
jgi:hypothetical protein